MAALGNWIVVLIALVSATGLAKASDESEIKETANTFGQALSKGDVAGAKKVAASDEATVGFIENAAPMIAASNKLSDAATSKYGEEGRSVSLLGGVATSLANLTKLSNNAKVNVTGDTATVEAPRNSSADQTADRSTRGGRGPQAMHFKKEDGKWKVDLSNSATNRGNNSNFKMMSQAFNETADEIKAGKYPTADEARQALMMKIVAAARNGQGRGQ